MSVLLWVILPYWALSSFTLGLIWRYRRDRFDMHHVARHPDRQRYFGITLLRCGAWVLIAGRIADVVVSRPDTANSGAHFCVIACETIGAIAAVIGAVILLVPTVMAPRRRSPVTWLDHATLPVLAAATISALAVQFDPTVRPNNRAADTLYPWLRSMFCPHPHPELMAHAPALYQIRGLIILLVLAIWPFTRFAGILTAPLAARLANTLERHSTARRRVDWQNPQRGWESAGSLGSCPNHLPPNARCQSSRSVPVR